MDVIQKNENSNTIIFNRTAKDRFALDYKTNRIIDKEMQRAFTGTIEILDKIEYCDEKGNILTAKRPTAFFSIKNGHFDGEQIYLLKFLNQPIYIRTVIDTKIQTVSGGVQYHQVNKNQSYDIFDGTFSDWCCYYKIDKDTTIRIKANLYYSNGNAVMDGNEFIYSVKKLIPESEDHQLLTANTQVLKIFHSNGKLAYNGRFFANKQLLDDAGEFYNQNGEKTAASNFFIFDCLDNREEPRGNDLNFQLAILLESYLSYSSYFGN